MTQRHSFGEPDSSRQISDGQSSVHKRSQQQLDVGQKSQPCTAEHHLTKSPRKRAMIQTSIEPYCIRMPLHPPTKSNDVQVLEKRKRQATIGEFFAKKPRI